MQPKIYRSIQIISVALMFGFAYLDFMAHPDGGKLFMGYLSIIITVTGYLLYIVSMYKNEPHADKRVKPHPLSWALFGLLTGTGWMIQEAGGGQAGSWCLGLTAAFCFAIATVSYLKYKEEWHFSWDDWAWVIAGAALFLFYIVTDTPVLSSTLATLADLAGYGPTIKKGWKRPYSDNPVNFIFNSVKCLPAMLALSTYSYSTSVYLWMLLVMNGLVALMLVARRAYVVRVSFVP